LEILVCKNKIVLISIAFICCIVAIYQLSTPPVIAATPQLSISSVPNCWEYCSCNGPQCLTHPPGSLYCNQDTTHKPSDQCKWWDPVYERWHNDNCQYWCCNVL